MRQFGMGLRHEYASEKTVLILAGPTTREGRKIVNAVKRIACFCFVTLTLTGDTGTSVRPNASDYDAHQTIREAAIGASILPAAEVARVFSGAVSKKYTVVEIAVYPQNSRGFDVAAIDFALKTGPDDRIYAITPEQVAWQGKHAHDSSTPSISGGANGVHVVTEAGIAVGTRTNPATGRTEHGVATYGGVEVDNRPQSNPPPQSGSNDNIYVPEGKLRGMELQEGPTTRPISGYLYFAGPKKQKTTPLVLEYSRSGERALLSLPNK